MKGANSAGAAATLLLVTCAAVYLAIGRPVSQAFAQDAESSGTVLYWQNPDGKPDYSPVPKQTEDGRPFVPVYDTAEKDISPARPAAEAQGKSDRKILYYRNPMGLPDTSPVPKKDWMGMDYIPVYEGDEPTGSSVVVSLDKVQRTGVRTEEVRKRQLSRLVRAPAIAKPDERTLHVVALRADAFIEKLFVNETGQHVKAGAPLFRIYSPNMVTAQINYQIAVRNQTARNLSGAEQQLRNLEIPDDVLQRLRATGEPVMSIDWPAPIAGVVMEKRVVEGQMARMGDELFRFADLSRIWVVADVAEQDLAAITVGTNATIRFAALPSDTFIGKVTFVLHELDPATRTGKVRIEVANPDHRIKHEMYATADIEIGESDTAKIAVPNSSVIDSGTRQVVLVARGEGRFEPRDVKLGIRGEDYVEILSGVAAGENVVIAANFLIDAESNLKAALSSFSADSSAQTEPTK